jgi:DNA-directed RNA polymerase specialized sigma24 family protein
MILGRRQCALSLAESDEFAAAALETYLKAIRARDRFAHRTNLRAWLYTILNNTWRRNTATANRQPATDNKCRMPDAGSRLPVQLL